MSNVDELIKRFTDRIWLHENRTRSLAKANLLDRAVLSEPFCRDIVNILLTRAFKSTNTRRANADTIDLDDDTPPPVCAQVTIRQDRAKIDETLKQFFEKNLHNKYDEIYFFIIGAKPDYDEKKRFLSADGFLFKPAIHVISIPEMIKMAAALPLERLEALVATAEKHLDKRGKAVGWWRRNAVAGCVAALTLAMGLFAGYKINLGAERTVVIPGANALEQQINRAKMEGITTTLSSAQFVEAYVFARPSLSRDSLEQMGDQVALSNASPLEPEGQDLVFAAGRCRFLGHVKWQDLSALTARAVITVISCQLDNRDTYELGNYDGPGIGMVVRAATPAIPDLQLIKEDRAFTLPANEKYVIRFTQPIHQLHPSGKSAIAW
ncbi:SMEK domain-containing protein [Duganella sp. FT109W]|uniref:SMEK domain-containing protein n=1 Tax=Duganella margarita TaxID=2692170 RepID=A0ABW9WJY5_9BURK|nr:SMEK domain-containing protein [Duganella margarita]MYN41381.1 SMEK domain-containing protein [Duganella margarita]